MELFSADARVFKKKIAHGNIKKLASKVAYLWQFFFSLQPQLRKTAQDYIVLLFFHWQKTVSVDLRVSRIYRHLVASPSFGGQIAGAGGTLRLS